LYNAANHGTGGAAIFGGQSIAGKTGTTSSNRDRWFCGYTGHYTAAVWCGFDTPAVIRPLYVNNPSAALFKKVMTPIHKGLSDVKLFDTSDMVWATMCVDSGKYANSACGADVRGKRTESAMLYPEDREGGGCTKHVLVDYCSGGGVATEYCHMFAEVDGSVSIGQKGLLKVTQSELSNMLAPGGYMASEFHQNNYIYLIGKGGGDAVFHGIKGDLVQWRDAPYMICPEHTKAAWEAYEAEQATEPEETQPMEPVPGVGEPSATEPVAAG
jgi:membrane peptidoglycan carboxypeptidase